MSKGKTRKDVRDSSTLLSVQIRRNLVRWWMGWVSDGGCCRSGYR